MAFKTRINDAIYHVHVTRKTPEAQFFTRVDALCVFEGHGGPPILLDTVMVHERDPEFCPVSLDKSYGIYLRREDRESAKKDGIEAIKQFRRNVEGVV